MNMIGAGKYLQTISIECNHCKGRLWNDDSKKRQASAMARFGKIPNHCVNSEIDGPKCPFHNS